MATLQPRELTKEEKDRLVEAKKRLAHAQEEVKDWSLKLRDAIAESADEKMFLRERDYWTQERDKERAELNRLMVDLGQVPSGVPKTLASLPVAFRQQDYRRSEELSFCKPANYKDIVGKVAQTFNTAPGSGRMAVPLVIGASGIGKTRTVFEASMEALTRANYTGAFARIFVNDIVEIEFPNVSTEKIIATLLAREFLAAPLESDVLLDLPSLVKKLKDDLHITVLIVHIDEYQYNLTLAQRLVSQIVRLNRYNTPNVRCIPIVSGVPKVRLEEGLDATSSWQPNHCILQPVPGLSRIVTLGGNC